MRQLFLTLFIMILSCSFLSTTLEAKRFGGGRSFGISRSASQFSRPTHTAPAAPAATPNNGMSKWLAPLAAFAAGGALASLFAGHGMGSGLFTILAGIFVIFLLMRLFQNRTAQFQPQAMRQTAAFMNQPETSTNNTPTHFDESDFLRQAKTAFFRLQAAYDNKNIADLREFTAPEIFAEIQMQLQERGDAANQTDVMNVETQLLDVAEENQATIASVLFTAQMREEQNAAFSTVKETWHFRKDTYRPNWVVAGIQQ